MKNLPGTEPDVSYAYDNLDRLTSASQTGNALSFTYDALSRKLTETGPQGTVTTQYDLAGRRTQITYPGTGLFVNYDYLVTGETTAVRENGATSGVGVLASFAYDNLGNRTLMTLGNGVTQASTYDPISRLASHTNDLSGTANDLSATFSLNPASQFIQTVRTGDAYAFTQIGSGSTAYTQNGLNQQVTIGGSTATWDGKGNLTTDPSTAKTYGYSSENLLTSASGGVTLAYDPSMRLYQVAAASTTRFAYDGSKPIAEYDGSNALLRRYVFGNGQPAPAEAGDPIVWYEGTGTTDRRFMSRDEKGSVLSLTDSSGTLIGIDRYDEYGRPAAANLGRYQYTGQKWLPEAGVYDYKTRDYLPQLGIFAQTDPISYAGDGPNLYAYVLDDPVNKVDPFGLAWPDNPCPTVGEDIVCTGTRPWQPLGTGLWRGALLERPSEPRPPKERPQQEQPKPKPKFCSSDVYKTLDDLDNLLGKAQLATLASAGLSRTEPYKAMRIAGTARAFQVYGYLGAARLTVNLGKAVLGDYRGALVDITTKVLGKAAGLDQLGEIIGGEAADAITKEMAGNPCK